MLYVSYSRRTCYGRGFDSSKDEKKPNIKSEMYNK